MRTVMNLMIAFLFGVLTFFLLRLIVYALFAVLLRDTASERVGEVVTVFAIFLWPFYVCFPLVAMAVVFLRRQSRDDRKDEEALAQAFRDFQ